MEIRYSIKDLENFTGIKAHTIRIWEQRYNLLAPQRTDTNIRFYSEEDLKKILNINLLYTNGIKISKIAALSEGGIITKAKELIHNSGNLSDVNENDIDDLILATLDFDKERIINMLSSAWKNNGIIDTYINLINPYIVKIGTLWQINTIEIVHEHFFSNTLRELFYTNINELNVESINKTVVLFLHEGEQHELVILMYYYLFKSHGYDCFYFGRNLPTSNLEHVFKKIKPEYLVTTFTSMLIESKFADLIAEIKTYSADSKVIVSGSQCHMFSKQIPSSFIHLKDPSALKKFLHKIQ